MIATALLLLAFLQQTDQPAGSSPALAITRTTPDIRPCGLDSGSPSHTLVVVTVDEKGDPHAPFVRTSSGNKCLDKAAIAVVKTYRFRPATQNGKPIIVEVGIDVSFSKIPGTAPAQD